jgi:CheY-like chemotaxis protein
MSNAVKSTAGFSLRFRQKGSVTSAHSASFPSATREPETILLIVPDTTERSALSLVLRSVGFVVVEAETGEQGEEMRRSLKLDLVITDLMMAERDGIEILRAIRRDSPRLPVLVLHDPHDPLQSVIARAVLGLGARAVIPKPVEALTLVKEVRRLLAFVPNSDGNQTQR